MKAMARTVLHVHYSLDSALSAARWPGACSLEWAVLRAVPPAEREFFIDNLLVRIHFIIVMIRWTGLAPWFHLRKGLRARARERERATERERARDR